MDRTVGLIGLGTMGRGMAAPPCHAGYPVRVCGVRAEAAAAFGPESGTARATPAELAADREVVVNAAQTEEMRFGKGGVAAAMKKGSLFVFLQ